MNKKIIILFVMISMLLISCSNKDNKTTEPDSSEKDTNTYALAVPNSMTSEIKINSSLTTEDNNLNNNILKDNKLNVNTEKIQLIAVRDGNTGKTVLEITDKDTLAKFTEEIVSVEFIEREAIDACGWRYELIINADEEIHIVISGNTQLYICTRDGSQIINCKTDFDLLGYIENNLLATDNTSYVTEDEHLDKNILKDNKLIINSEKIQSIAVRDGNTGETVLEITDKDTIAKIAEEIASVPFMEHEAVQSDGWRYELIITADKKTHIVISGNTHLYIWIEDISQKIDCETSFDLLGYIENTLLNSKK